MDDKEEFMNKLQSYFKDDVVEHKTSEYTALRMEKENEKKQNFAEIHFQKKGVVIYLNGTEFSEAELGRVNKVPDTHGWALNYKLRIRGIKDLDGNIDLVKKSYMGVKQSKSVGQGHKMCEEYDNKQKWEIDALVRMENKESKEDCWSGREKRKELEEILGSNTKRQKRSSKVAANALKRAEYRCEFNLEDRLFKRKGGNINYTEPHHLIPLENHSEFENSLDIEENIVSLCSHCHNLLHYGELEDKRKVLEKIFKGRKEPLENAKISISSKEQLIKYYK